MFAEISLNPLWCLLSKQLVRTTQWYRIAYGADLKEGFSSFVSQEMQVLDRIAELGETMYRLEHRDNSGHFPAKTCRDLQLCHSIYDLEDGKNYPRINN